MKEAVSLKLTASFLNMAPPAGLEPATYGLTVHRHGDFQSPALPTELSRRNAYCVNGAY